MKRLLVQQTTVMASHLSAVKEVLELSAPDVLLLQEQDEPFFFHDPATSSAESSSDEENPLESASSISSGTPFNCSDEESLDPPDPADRSTASLAAVLVGTQPGPKRQRLQELTTLEQVTERAEEECECARDKIALDLFHLIYLHILI